MGKKFKMGSKQSPMEGQENMVNKEVAATGHMGISKKSMKIKKHKHRENLTKNTVVPGTEANVEQAVVKEKKNKKHKTPPVSANSGEREPGVELNENGSEAVVSKKFKAPEVELEHTEQGKKKKLKKKKVPVESEPEVSAGGIESDVVLKSKKKKRKAPEGETEVTDSKPKKHKKHKNSDKLHASTGGGNATEMTGSKKEAVDKPQKKHKKKNKHKHHLNGRKAESQPSAMEPKTKDKHHKKALEADRDVVTSESESEDEQNDASNEMDRVNQSILQQHSKADGDQSSGDEQASQKTKDQKVTEEKKKKRFTGPEHSIFIGNLPNTVKKSTMKSMFKPYGQILTVRFRSNDGVTLFKKKDRKEAKALNCYIRFATREEAEAACATNGQLVEGNRIRVTIHTQKQMGHAASTVFVGNINKKTTDNELYDFFSRVGDIEYVRQIADKGIGYVCFKKGVSIAKALKLNQQLLNGRPLRIMKIDPTKQGKRRNKKGNLVDKAKFSRPGGPTNQSANEKNQRHGGQKQEFHGAVAKSKSDNKHKQKKGGWDKKKKLLALKLTAAGASRNK